MAISKSDLPTTSIFPQALASHAVPKPLRTTKSGHGPPRNFGAFRKLRAKVRLKIWQYLMPELRDDIELSLSREAFGSPVAVPVQRDGNRLAILRTSRAFKDEIEAELYRRRTMTFTIRPQWRGWRVENLPGSTMTDFVHTNFNRFKSIKVDIFCPQRDDPAQLLYARASIYNIVRLLRGQSDDIGQCEPYSTRDDQKRLESYSGCVCDQKIPKNCANIPRVEVTFRDEGSNTWHENGFSHVTFVDTPWLGDDLRILLAAFGFLHVVQNISFIFPQGSQADSYVNQTVEFVQKIVSIPPAWDRKYDIFIKEEAEHYLGLDWALDTAPGPTAAILRRERLIHNRWYRRSIEHFLDLHCNRRKYFNIYATPSSERYRDFESLDRSYLDHGWKLQYTQDPKWLEEWRGYWPSGIPPKGSAEWNALVALASPEQRDPWS